MTINAVVPKPRTQAEIIRDHLATKGSITQMEASGLYCITDLAGRIRDIRARANAYQAGMSNDDSFPFDVVSEQKSAPNGTRYVRYWNEDHYVGFTTIADNKNGTYTVAV